MVDELRPVVEVQPGHLERDRLDAQLERGQDMNVRVVADRSGEHPPGVHVRQVHRPAELAFQGRSAVRDGITLEEPRHVLDLVTGFADRDRRTQ